MHYPKNGCIDPYGYYIFADQANSIIRRLSITGNIQNIAGKPGYNGKINSNRNDSRFYWPSAVIICQEKDISHLRGISSQFPAFNFNQYWNTDENNKETDINIYNGSIESPFNFIVADEYNHCLRYINSNGDVYILAGDGKCGSADGKVNEAQFFDPKGLAYHYSGQKLFVSDCSNQSIRCISNGKVSTLYQWESVSINGELISHKPHGIYLISKTNLLVADSAAHCIYNIDIDTGVCKIFAGKEFCKGLKNDKSESLFDSPSGVTMDYHRNILIADTNNNSIRLINPNHEVSTLIGISNFELIHPTCITYDSRLGGILYITDEHSVKALKFSDSYTNWARRCPFIIARQLLKYSTNNLNVYKETRNINWNDLLLERSKFIISPPEILPPNKFDVIFKSLSLNKKSSTSPDLMSIESILAEEAVLEGNRVKMNCAVDISMLVSEKLFEKILSFI